MFASVNMIKKRFVASHLKAYLPNEKHCACIFSLSPNIFLPFPRPENDCKHKQNIDICIDSLSGTAGAGVL